MTYYADLENIIPSKDKLLNVMIRYVNYFLVYDSFQFDLIIARIVSSFGDKPR